MDRRLLAIALCVAALALTSASPVSRSVQGLRGGASQASASSSAERMVYVGSSEYNEDPNEPFIRDSEGSSDGLLSSGEGNARVFNADWSSARVELTEIIKEREALAGASKGLRLRGGSAAPAQAKNGMVPVTVKVSAHHIHPINSPPVKVVICGEGPELGNWELGKGVELKSVHSETESFTASAAGAFPEHTGTIMLPAGKSVEFKFAVTLVDPACEHPVKAQWEAVNRKISVPASGAMEIRCEFMEARDSDPRITDEPFQCNAQEWARYYRHHISGLSEVQPGREG
uniref:CBM20 domain-containing protein n=1 Tax=Hemiselmis andersenii TaxID=464988 RepID=A0A7S0TYE1_HEMAN|mmetsp:Transcript_25399/g.58660  ORF Transcript_25399/g.58660 Transcript_25399/m.58660 type:complete len:288 (+) Transcript_25399:68-931(+)|eukprot:CAMPEP_0114130882 /NCGR_PEP_ID=MMETSP0043_2-20121206/12255_1 /TAXON_ID=464988 /ORGANISM="Hemiselmis andersenii, Strain CCMP644" /LENGTH=287 /DNA_ID=CAMNT_0001224273 /DNA_START=47 /DNA_END=910 /DNA_ORIENTATION=+